MLWGSRLSPIEKRGKCWRSSTRTERPARRKSAAATAPAGPAPMIATSTVMRFDECVLKVASIVCLQGTALRCILTFRYNYASQQEQYFVGAQRVAIRNIQCAFRAGNGLRYLVPAHLYVGTSCPAGRDQ